MKMPESMKTPDSVRTTSDTCAACMGEREVLRARISQLANENLRLHEELRGVHEAMRAHVATTSRIVAKRCDEEWRDVLSNSEAALNLHAASARLHEGAAERDVLQAIEEIVINLIGSEEVAVFEVRPEGDLAMLSSFGVDARRLGRVPADDGVFGRVIRGGEAYVRREGEPAPIDQPDMSACVPLKLGGRVVGVVAIYRLLEHKRALRELDRELLDLVSAQAAPALWGARAFEGRT